MIDNRDGQAYLDAVLEKIRQRILSINESLLEGQKVIFDTETDPKNSSKLRAVNVCIA